MNLIFARACDDCGAEAAVMLVENKPTPAQRKEVRVAVGDGYCVSEYVFRNLEVGEIVTAKKGEP